MKFLDSGLPQNTLTEKAFNYSYKNIMGRAPEVVEGYNKEIEAAYQRNLKKLEMTEKQRAKTDKPMSKIEIEMHKRQINQMRDTQIKRGPVVVKQHLEGLFKERRLAAATEIVKHSSHVNPKLLSTILLVECVQSPIDFKNIETIFGDDIAMDVANLLHLDAYPSERSKNVNTLSKEAKTAFGAMIVSSLSTVLGKIEQSKKAGSNAPQIHVPPGQESQIVSDIKLIWGNDKKLDKRFVELFNKFAEATTSPYRVEVDAKGDLEFIKSALPKKGGPKKPNNNDNKPPSNDMFGGPVFD